MRLSALLGKLPPELVRVGASYLMGELPQGRVGMGFGTLRDLHGGGATPPPTAVATLRLEDVDGALTAVERMRGGGLGRAARGVAARAHGARDRGRA